MFRVLVTLFLVFSTTIYSAEELWEEDKSWLSFVLQNEALFNEVSKFAASLNNKNTASVHDLRRWNKLLGKHEPHERKIMERMLGHLRNRIKFDSAYHDRPIADEMEEIVVIGRLFDQFPMDPAEFSYQDITAMRGIRMTANELYRNRKYDQAYPLLLDLAKRGFKDSQSRLAYILFTGTEKVDKSNLRALGWLGTAAYGESEPMFRVLFNKYMREVPDSVKATVTAVINGYRERYDSSSYIDCTTNHRFNQGVVKRTYCQFDLEARVEAGVPDRSANKVSAQTDDSM